jgi:hypothetical protein
MNPFYTCKVKFRLHFVAVFFFSVAFGQEKNATYSAFAIDNKEVIWVRIYDVPEPTGVLTEEISNFLKRKAWIRNLYVNDGEIVADIKNFRVDYKRYGGKYMNTSNLIRTARWSGKLRISVKDSRYRVVVYGLEYDARQPAMHAGKMSNQSHMIHGTWTDWVLNTYRSKFKRSRHINMDIMHFNLKDGFAITGMDFVDEEW